MADAEGPGSSERAWLLVCSCALAGIAVLTGKTAVEAGDAFAIGFPAALIAAALAVGCGWLRLRHLPWVWLVANAYGAAMWKDLMQLPDGLRQGVIVMLVLAALGLLVAALVAHSSSRVAKVFLVLAVVGGAALSWFAPHVGSGVWVWRHETSLLQQAHVELVGSFEGIWANRWGGGDIVADRRDSPLQRVAFYWSEQPWRPYIKREPVGVVYDPTGAIRDPACSHQFLGGARVWHLFGPWYRFAP